MITIVVLLFLPMILIMSLFRLYKLPRDILAKRKLFNPSHRLVAMLASGAAYCALGFYTAAILVGFFSALKHVSKNIDEIFTAGSVLVPYPFVYLIYEWVYHYALDPRPSNH